MERQSRKLAATEKPHISACRFTKLTFISLNKEFDMNHKTKEIDGLEEFDTVSYRVQESPAPRRAAYSPRHDHARRRSPLSNHGAHRRRHKQICW